MKRLISFGIVFLLMLLSIRTYAFDWKSLNVDLMNRKVDGSKTVLTLQDKQAQIFKVIYQDEALTTKLVDKIIKFKDEFYTWKDIHFQIINFMVFANFLEVVIIPQEITHNRLNLAQAISAGITMIYDPEQEVMHYDFRIQKETLFVRVTGDYLNEGELLTKLFFAYDYPLIYTQRTEPEALLKENERLKNENEKIRQALIYLNNEDWNGQQKTIPAETIRRIVELKRKNPALTKNQLWQKLKKEKVRITKRELDLVLLVYFNEIK